MGKVQRGCLVSWIGPDLGLHDFYQIDIERTTYFKTSQFGIERTTLSDVNCVLMHDGLKKPKITKKKRKKPTKN